VEMANTVMAFPCEGFVRREDREKGQLKGEEDGAEESMESLVDLAVPDFSCLSQAWGELKWCILLSLH
jgi:hypothetical protein